MDRDGEATSSGLGAGGKFRKPPAMRPPSTPYDRPPSSKSQTGQRRWLSKLVDPACRLISSGATLIFPSFFSKSDCSDALPAPSSEDHDERHTEVEQDVSVNDHFHALKQGMSRSTGVPGPIRAAERLKSSSDFEEHKQDTKGGVSEDNGLSEIEKLMIGKNFSRDEINLLVEIIHSRAVDSPNVEQERENPNLTARGEVKGPAVDLEIPKSTEQTTENLNRTVQGASIPLLQSTRRNDIGDSPVAIARAYMGTRTSEIGLGSKNMISKDERALLHGDEFASKMFLSSLSPKSAICWPGAMVQDQHGYLTPQNQQRRFGLHNLPRTPYSRTIFSKSKSKMTQLRGDSSRYLNISSTPLQQSQISAYGQAKSRSDALGDNYGSVGPIRRIRNKAVAEEPSRGSVYYRSSLNEASEMENSNISESFWPANRKNLESGGTSGASQFHSVDSRARSFEVGAPTVPQHYSQLAMKILEHIDRNPPTPKDKHEELKLATAWKKPPSSEASTLKPSECNSLSHSSVFDLHKNVNQVDQKNSAQRIEVGENSHLKIPHQEGANQATNAVNNKTPSFDVNFGSAVALHGSNAEPKLNFRETLNSQIRGKNEDVSKTVLNAAGSGILNFQKKAPAQSSGAKPVLPFISIDKPDSRQAFSSDNRSGFTFPVSESNVLLSDLPTPSFMPSFSASGLRQQKEGVADPVYSFGSKKSTSLVFSFPSTSSAAICDDASDLKFDFRSDQKTRVSFGSLDAICH